MIFEERHSFGAELILLAKLGEQADIARRSVPEPEIFADHDRGRVQAVDEHRPDEVLGG